MRAIIYGATTTGKKIYQQIAGKYQISYFIDGNPKLWGHTVDGIEIKNPDEASVDDADIVFIGVILGYEEAVEIMMEKGFLEEQIITKFVDLSSRARRDNIEKIAVIFEDKKIEGALAEVGVYRGDFAKVLNEAFPHRTLYLFDTFEGFPEQDMQYEEEQNLMLTKVGMLSNTSVEFVLGRMPHPEKCVVKKGYFPDTAEGLEEHFSFVNIDTDLYKPIIAGLEFFWPRMVENGYIFVHDYFSSSYGGARKAIDEFAQKHHVGFLPIGDTLSVAFIKK